MDFAKKILNKYGWKEGEGLGKNNNGIAKPIKAKYKFDTAGLGQDIAASDFNNHWWERVFNEAAENVEIQKQKDGEVSLKTKDDIVEITTKGYSMKKLKKAKQVSNDVDSVRYGNFLQTATLTKAGNEVEEPNKIEIDDIEVPKYKILSDEELFKACGGRTAHKGARHGLKLNGKLNRLEQQEKEMLAKLQNKFTQEGKTQSESKTEKEAHHETKRKRKMEASELEVASDLPKKKSKKNRKSNESFIEQDSSVSLLENSNDGRLQKVNKSSEVFLKKDAKFQVETLNNSTKSKKSKRKKKSTV